MASSGSVSRAQGAKREQGLDLQSDICRAILCLGFVDAMPTKCRTVLQNKALQSVDYVLIFGGVCFCCGRLVHTLDVSGSDPGGAKREKVLNLQSDIYRAVLHLASVRQSGVCSNMERVGSGYIVCSYGWVHMVTPGLLVWKG